MQNDLTFSKYYFRDFPGSPVIKTSPSSEGGTHVSQPKKKRKNIKQKQYYNNWTDTLKMVYIEKSLKRVFLFLKFVYLLRKPVLMSVVFPAPENWKDKVNKWAPSQNSAWHTVGADEYLLNDWPSELINGGHLPLSVFKRRGIEWHVWCLIHGRAGWNSTSPKNTLSFLCTPLCCLLMQIQATRDSINIIYQS